MAAPAVGTRVRLLYCSDPHTRIAFGTLGTVRFVDSLGTVHVSWDDGSRLGLIAEAGDRYEVAEDAHPGRPIFDGYRVHQGTQESGNLRTACGLDVTGWWRLVDGREIDCVECVEAGRAS